MRAQNQEGPAPLGVLARPPAMGVGDFARARDEGAIVLDCRQPEAFGGGHVPGSINVGLGSSFPSWAGSVLPDDRPVLLVLERSDDLLEICWHLLRIGYDLPRGWLAGGMMAWRIAGRDIDRVAQWTVDELQERKESGAGLFVLDVRQPNEWAAGHVPGARHIPGAELAQRLDELPSRNPVAVYCGSGFRSSVAASLIKASGRDLVFNVLGGFTAWQARELPVDTD
jgi:hydroxyacylglutathione hydrolase